ncbi:ATP synthase subunit 8 (mitochondrion) [[Candida] anglica]|uniref:ATP synthase protein 8 n=1 Tax=[Candida] anglica TaxID=148631 RepID=A0ABP0EQY1_9ASCO
MPQLVPFYFMNLLTFGMLGLSMMLFMVSTRMLPEMLRLLVARMIMVKL